MLVFFWYCYFFLDGLEKENCLLCDICEIVVIDLVDKLFLQAVDVDLPEDSNKEFIDEQSVYILWEIE